MEQRSAAQPVKIGIEEIGRKDADNYVLVEPDHIGEVLVDGILSINVVDKLPRLSFYVDRQTRDGNKRVLVARLAMTPESANTMSMALRSVLDRMEGDGVIPKLPNVVIE